MAFSVEPSKRDQSNVIRFIRYRLRPYSDNPVIPFKEVLVPSSSSHRAFKLQPAGKQVMATRITSFNEPSSYRAAACDPGEFRYRLLDEKCREIRIIQIQPREN